MINLISSSLIAVLLSLFQPQPSYFISGKVQDETGKPACGVRVCALAADFDPNKPNEFIPCSVSDQRGRFTIAVYKSSKYTLVYDYSKLGYYSTYLPFFRPLSPLPEVVVDDSSVPPPVTITMSPRNGVLAGKGIDTQTGLPVESMVFKLCHATDPFKCWTINEKNPSGYFKLVTPHVPFTFRIKAEGFEEWLGPNGDKEMPISVAPETKSEFAVLLKRSAGSTGKAVSDTEKNAGVDLPAPTQLAPANDAVFNHYPRYTKLEWAPVEGAVSYSVEIDYCDGMTIKNRSGCVDPQPHKLKDDPSTSGIVTTTYEFRFVGAQPGRWRVWAVDKEGREGFKSPWRRFIYHQ